MDIRVSPELPVEASGPSARESVHVSDWLDVTQAMVDEFAHATGDSQWIHTDPARAAAESPFGATIAHGYLLLSLYPKLRGLFAPEQQRRRQARSVINYGLNKCRFPSPVRVGRRIRGRSELIAEREISGGLEIVERFTIEIEGEEKPGCVAEVLIRYYD